MKLAVIGAGSTYTPELVSGLMRERERVGVRELVLHDIDPVRREVVGGLARRIVSGLGEAHTRMQRSHVLTDEEGYLYTRYVKRD